MNEHGIVTGKGTIRFERVLPGPIERVWAYLTDSDKRAKWLAAGDMDLRIGGRVELTFRHADLSPHQESTPERFKTFENGVSVVYRVTKCDPPRLLGMTWGGPEDESEVTFELTPLGDEVRLVLTHSRLADRNAMVMVSGGWHTHLAILADNLASETPRPFWSTFARAEAEYEKRIPAS
jgi:uncharacterized protein YndB with AHSA1/START domain